MTRFVGMVVLLAALIAAVGFYRGWFRAESHDDHGQSTVTVTVDKDKVNQDKSDLKQDVQDLGHK
ncbi:MAG: hypothetical protein ABSH22_11205 [Tepidisphaeraceae bacterium]